MPRKKPEPKVHPSRALVTPEVQQQKGAAIYYGLGSPAVAEAHAAQVAAAKSEPKNLAERIAFQQGGVEALEAFRAREDA